MDIWINNAKYWFAVGSLWAQTALSRMNLLMRPSLGSTTVGLRWWHCLVRPTAKNLLGWLKVVCVPAWLPFLLMGHALLVALRLTIAVPNVQRIFSAECFQKSAHRKSGCCGTSTIVLRSWHPRDSEPPAFSAAIGYLAVTGPLLWCESGTQFIWGGGRRIGPESASNQSSKCNQGSEIHWYSKGFTFAQLRCFACWTSHKVVMGRARPWASDENIFAVSGFSTSFCMLLR